MRQNPMVRLRFSVAPDADDLALHFKKRNAMPASGAGIVLRKQNNFPFVSESRLL
jgi:hypothetical protein